MAGIRKKRQTLNRNVEHGKQGERFVSDKLHITYDKIKRLRKGGDYDAKQISPITGRTMKHHIIEVKTGNAKQSKAQKEMQKKHPRIYKVERLP